jgi:hypothetical protein
VCRPRRLAARQPPVTCIGRLGDPRGTVTSAPLGDCRPSRASGSGSARPLQHGRTPLRGKWMPDQRCAAHSCRGEALPHPTAPQARQTRWHPTVGADDPGDTLPTAPALDSRPSRAGGAGSARPRGDGGTGCSTIGAALVCSVVGPAPAVGGRYGVSPVGARRGAPCGAPDPRGMHLTGRERRTGAVLVGHLAGLLGAAAALSARAPAWGCCARSTDWQTAIVAQC